MFANKRTLWPNDAELALFDYNEDEWLNQFQMDDGDVSVFGACMKRDVPGYKIGEYADIVIDTTNGNMTFREEGEEDSAGTTFPIAVVGMNDVVTRVQDDSYKHWPESDPIFAYNDDRCSNQFDCIDLSLYVYGVRTVRDMPGIRQGEDFEYIVIDVSEGKIVFHRNDSTTLPVLLTIANPEPETEPSTPRKRSVPGGFPDTPHKRACR